MEDGNIICTGSVQKHPPWNSGWILKLDSDGDSLWYRLYNYFYGDGSFNDLDDIIQTDDSGFLACGGLFPIPPDTGIQSAWVIKIDSIGCDFVGCDTTVGIQEQQGGMGAWEHGGLEIWPNPAREILNFKFSILNSGRDYSIYIYDVFGRDVYTEIVSGGEEEWTVNISSLSPGIYMVVCKDNENRVSSGKFIKSQY